MTKVNSGYDQQFRQMAGDLAGTTGNATATTATTLTDSGASWTTNAYKGHVLVATLSANNVAVTGFRFGIVVSNTSTAFTVDQWYAPGSPGTFAAASTPSSTAAYYVLSGGAPCWYMGLTADTGAVSTSDTTLPSEITTSGGGLIRKICTVAHSASASTYTLAATFTANGSDTLPVTIHKVGISPSILSTTALQLFESVLSADATLNASGDAVTVTDTVTM